MTIVLLHPLPFDGTVWDDVRVGLPGEVCAPDLYALGDTLEEWAAGVLAMTGEGPIAVVGNSVGGSCAIEMARLAPGRVERLVLVGAKAGHRPEPAFRDEAIAILATEGIDVAWQRYWRPLFAPGTDDAVLAHAHELVARQDVGSLITGVNAFHSRLDRDAFIRTVPVPITVVSGQFDLNPRASKQLADELVDGRYREIGGIGHYAPLERPGELAEIIADAVQAGGRM
jgi:pimeloyl-ACP methyl ester carboxylesterase